MSTLEEFKAYLAVQYKDVLGLKLVENSSDNLSYPIWLEQDNQAWLLDSGIGLGLRIVPFVQAEQDLNVDIQRVLQIASLLQPRHGLKDEEADAAGVWQLGIIWLV